MFDALETALSHRDVQAGLLHQLDRGSQYASGPFQQRLREENIACGMSRQGNCWDNARMENYCASLNNERGRQEGYRTRADARTSIFYHRARFYNRQRRHSALGGLSPEQYERSL